MRFGLTTFPAEESASPAEALAMKAIWTREGAELHGRHVDFDPIWSWPKPLVERYAELAARHR